MTSESSSRSRVEAIGEPDLVERLELDAAIAGLEALLLEQPLEPRHPDAEGERHQLRRLVRRRLAGASCLPPARPGTLALVRWAPSTAAASGKLAGRLWPPTVNRRSKPRSLSR